MRKLAVPALLVGIALLLSSCGAVVPLDIDLITAHNRGLSMEGMVGPVDKAGSPSEIANSFYIPGVSSGGGLDMRNGFVVFGSAGTRHMTYLWYDTDKNGFRRLSGSAFIGSSSDTYPQVILHSVKNGPREVAGFQFGDPGRIRGVVADTGTDTFAGAFDIDLKSSSTGWFPPLVQPVNPVGAAFAPIDDATRDMGYVLAQEPGTSLFFEYSVQVLAAGPIAPAPLRVAPAYDLSWLLPSNPTGVLYYYQPSASRSYACIYDAVAGKWRTYSWTGTTAGNGAELASDGRRIDALLTTGELLSTDGGTARVYDPDGVLLAGFDLAGMNFVEERFVKGTARLLFTYPVILDGSAWYITYSIATADVKSLNGR